ncbi:TRAP transporter large permease subunit [Thermotoga sp. SG1]|uniref:TRAP transporter large permease subunit n=1 Tax=Thermotoga sp. SG1 TaxID=126739 RepID=UPI000C78740F|nr:TRAP transporter large permease subunit [Thermotoga sp. SG1]PLV57408.1 C4-dicarboxylate ABC transporter [Thermotoga sp. SG1]
MIIVLIAFAVFLILGMPVAFAIGISGFLWFLQHPELPITIPIQRLLSQTVNFTLLAIPMFIVAGNVMNSAGVTKRLLDFASTLVGHMRGGLGQVSAVLSTLMGGVSGSSIADAAMETRMLGPEMLRRGYPRGFAVAVNVWTSLITPIIPPGIAFIIYGTIGQVSIGRLFAAGIGPGLLLMVVYMITIWFVAKRLNLEPEREGRTPIGEIFRTLGKSIWALIFPVLLIVGLRGGIFTPSEVGSFAVLYGLLVGFAIHREMSLKILYWETLENSLGDIGSVMFILSMSNIFGYGMIWERIPEKLAEFLLGISSNPNILMIMIAIFLVFAGLFVDATALILMLTAILLPVARQVGIDPVHFGLVFILSAAMGNQTPPVGASMYAGCSVLGATIEEYIQASWPFLFVTIVAILMIIFFPQIVLFIPNLIFG